MARPLVRGSDPSKPVEVLAAGAVVDSDIIAPATTSAPGHMTASQATRLGQVEVDVVAAQDTADAAQSDATAAGSVAATAIQNGTAPSTTATAKSLIVGKSGTNLQLRKLRPGDGQGVRSTTNDVIPFAVGTSSWLSPDMVNWVRNWSAKGRWWCGGFNQPTNPPHPAYDWPFTTFAILDYLGYPHHYHEWLENTNAGAESGYWGCEDGDYVEGGVLANCGRKLVMRGTGTLMCAAGPDTFIEFVVEPNHTTGTLNGANRMRFTGREIGLTWTGKIPFEFYLEWGLTYGTHFEYGGYFKAADTYYEELSGSLDPTAYDARVDDAIFSTRFRIDGISNIDTYDGTYQVNGGTNGVATERELEITRVRFEGIG